MPMFEKTFFVLAPSYHGATLLAKLHNAHPDLTALGDTYPSHAFDQVCGCGERVSRCPFWQAVKAEVCAERYPGTRMMLPLYPGDRGVWLDDTCSAISPPYGQLPPFCEGRKRGNSRAFARIMRPFFRPSIATPPTRAGSSWTV